MLIGAFGGVAAFMRLLGYHVGSAPASRWSMIVRGRPISLRYDQVFVPIIAILATSGAAALFATHLPLTGVQQMGLAAAGLLVMVLSSPLRSSNGG